MCCTSFPIDVDQDDKELFFWFFLCCGVFKHTEKLFDIKKLKTLKFLIFKPPDVVEASKETC